MENRSREAEGDPGALRNVVYEWLDAKPLLGGHAIDPWFVTIAKAGALASPALMSPRRRRARTRFLIEHRLPAYQGSPEGMLTSDKGQWALWRHAEACGRHIVQLHDFGLAMLVIEMCFNVQLDSLCRTDDLIQMQQDADAWKPVERAGGVDITFASIRKASPDRPLPKPEWIAVHPQAFIDMTFVAAEIARSDGHADGCLPKVQHSPGIRWKRPAAAAIVLQKGGRAISHQILNRCLSFLLCGVAVAKLHDLRHAGSARALDDGMPFIELMATLGHMKPAHTVWYSRPTSKMRSSDDTRSARRARVASGLRRVRSTRAATSR